jgi:hypothetical protein
MEANPYAAPAAVMDDVPAWNAADLESRKALRGKRVRVVLLNGLSNLFWMLPVTRDASMATGVSSRMALTRFIIIRVVDA